MHTPHCFFEAELDPLLSKRPPASPTSPPTSPKRLLSSQSARSHTCPLYPPTLPTMGFRERRKLKKAASAAADSGPPSSQPSAPPFPSATSRGPAASRSASAAAASGPALPPVEPVRAAPPRASRAQQVSEQQLIANIERNKQTITDAERKLKLTETRLHGQMVEMQAARSKTVPDNNAVKMVGSRIRRLVDEKKSTMNAIQRAEDACDMMNKQINNMQAARDLEENASTLLANKVDTEKVQKDQEDYVESARDIDEAQQILNANIGSEANADLDFMTAGDLPDDIKAEMQRFEEENAANAAQSAAATIGQADAVPSGAPAAVAPAAAPAMSSALNSDEDAWRKLEKKLAS